MDSAVTAVSGDASSSDWWACRSVLQIASVDRPARLDRQRNVWWLGLMALALWVGPPDWGRRLPPKEPVSGAFFDPKELVIVPRRPRVNS
jgi:hypothetical protein